MLAGALVLLGGCRDNASLRKSQDRPPEFEYLKLMDHGYQDGLLKREAESDSDTREEE